MYTDEDQILYENLLRFLNNNITKRRIDKILNYPQGMLLYWIIENSDHFKNEKK